MPTNKKLISIYAPDDIYNFLFVKAKKEKLSLSSFVKNILNEYMKEESRAAREKQNQAENQNVAAHVLWLISQNQRPSDEQIKETATMSGIAEERLLTMRDRLFPSET